MNEELLFDQAQRGDVESIKKIALDNINKSLQKYDYINGSDHKERVRNDVLHLLYSRINEYKNCHSIKQAASNATIKALKEHVEKQNTPDKLFDLIKKNILIPNQNELDLNSIEKFKANLNEDTIKLFLSSALNRKLANVGLKNLRVGWMERRDKFKMEHVFEVFINEHENAFKAAPKPFIKKAVTVQQYLASLRYIYGFEPNTIDIIESNGLLTERKQRKTRKILNEYKGKIRDKAKALYNMEQLRKRINK